MASDTKNRLTVLKETRQSMQENYENSTSKIQSVPHYIREGERYSKYYRPKLISIGPIHHDDLKLKLGEQYKLMWASMYAERHGKDPEDLLKRVEDQITRLRKLFSWDNIPGASTDEHSPTAEPAPTAEPPLKAERPPTSEPAPTAERVAHKHYEDKDLAWMLFVDGCSVLQILEKDNLSKPEELNVKVDQLVLVQRDLLLLENQLPYQVLKLLVDDEVKLKLSMRGFCELQNMFTLLGSPNSPLFKDPQRQIQNIQKSPPSIHLLDCLRTAILNDSVHADQEAQKDTQDEENLQKIMDAETIGSYFISMVTGSGNTTKAMASSEEPIRAIDLLSVAYAYADRNKNEKQTTYRTIQELKAAAIRMKRQKNVSLKNILFTSSLFGGELHLPPLILDDSTVPTLLNLVAYEMCPDFRNDFEISSYVKLLDLLIDHPEDVKELRETGILQNSLGSDEEVSELFNSISSGLVHNRKLYSKIRNEMEKHYQKRLSIWFTEAYYTYFRTPWTVIALVGAVLALVLTALQTWKAFQP